VFDRNGSTLYFTGPTGAFNVENCERGIIENLVIDWGNPFDPNPAGEALSSRLSERSRRIQPPPGTLNLILGRGCRKTFHPLFIRSIYGTKPLAGWIEKTTCKGRPMTAASCVARKKGPTQAMHLKGLSLYPNSIDSI
jgi:hypothetical protein